MMRVIRRSIKNQLVAVFLGIIVVLLLLLFVINFGFLENYYTMHKQSEMKELYTQMKKAALEENIRNAKVQEKLMNESERSNIAVIVLTLEQDRQAEVILYTDKAERGPLFTKLFGYMSGMTKGELLEEEDNYVIYREGSPMDENDYLEMYGTISEEILFFMQSPLESIRDSAKLANRFLLYVGLFGLVVGGIFVWVFSGKITNPLMELSCLSQRMADLDFDARYTETGENEIDILGRNFNTMSQRLEHTISELKEANNQLQKDIEKKQRQEDMRSEFIGNVSHELKTPIALIQGYAEGLKEGISDDPESRAFYCEVIMDEADKMNRMVKNLLMLNQLEFGNDKVCMNRFDLVKLVEGVIISCEILSRQAEAEVIFTAESEVFVWADEFKTEQVIRNYLTNAIHHVSGERKIEVKIIPQGNTVRFSVFNTGTPIPEEDLNKIWDKFYKVDKAHTREYGGNGIGLSIVKAIMESFHQSYGVKNYESGVEFWCEFDAKNMPEDISCEKKENREL